MTARLYTLNPLEGFEPKKFSGHRDVVINAFFSEDEKTVRLHRSSPLTIDLHRFP
jgi:periodic tryptophan protein 2